MVNNTSIYKHRWDSDIIDTVYLETNRKTLDSILTDYQTKELSCKQPATITRNRDIQTDHIIPEELHLLLRIADVAIN